MIKEIVDISTALKTPKNSTHFAVIAQYPIDRDDAFAGKTYLVGRYNVEASAMYAVRMLIKAGWPQAKTISHIAGCLAWETETKLLRADEYKPENLVGKLEKYEI